MSSFWHWFWIVLGIILIVAGLFDLFLSALNYDESGMITRWLQAGQWRVLRTVFRRLPEPVRAPGRAQVVGLQILLSVVLWVGLVLVGFGFVYYGLMYGHNFTFSGSDIGPSMDYAIYFSAGQLSTVGGSGVLPQNTLLRALSVLETLIGLGIVTLAISFLLGVFQTVTYLTTLSSDLYDSTPDASDYLGILALYIPKGQPNGLGDFLSRLYSSLGSYYAGLRLHHTAYYYQSRLAHISIPYTLHTLGGMIGALRWGVPEDSAVSDEPQITLLVHEFTAFLSYLDRQLHLRIADPPAAQPYEVFAPAFEGAQAPDDPWLNRFVAMERGMRQIVQAEQPADTHEAYGRYAEWLPFAYRAQSTMERIARNLDYDVHTEVYKPRS